jgi:hypothetical protein
MIQPMPANIALDGRGNQKADRAGPGFEPTDDCRRDVEKSAVKNDSFGAMYYILGKWITGPAVNSYATSLQDL